MGNIDKYINKSKAEHKFSERYDERTEYGERT